jgi:hypothetical protein
MLIASTSLLVRHSNRLKKPTKESEQKAMRIDSSAEVYEENRFALFLDGAR